MRISKRNRKKGSALITTVLVAVLVCAMVTLMLSLSLYGQSLAKAGSVQVVLQDRLDMLTSLFWSSVLSLLKISAMTYRCASLTAVAR